MSVQLSERINRLEESATILMAKKARELASQGVDVINLSLGEPDFTTPKHILEATKTALDGAYTFYTPVAGYLDLRQAVAAKLKNENGLDYAADQIVVSTGAKQSLTNAVMALVNPEEEVIIPTPYWVSYSEMVKLAEGESVFIPSSVESNFKITPAQLEAAITPKSKLFMFSSPCNPTGSVYTKEELAELVKVFEKHPQIYIISDEIYEHINFGAAHASIASFESVKDRVIIINGFSKGFAMTGWRLGYLAASKPIAAACDKLQSQITSATCSIAKRAALAALTSDMTPTYEMREAFRKRRDLVYNLIKDMKGLKVNLPEGAFYFFPDVSYFFGKSYEGKAINNSSDLSLLLLSEAHVSTVSGDSFGDPNSIRFSYATSEDKLIEAVRRISAFLEKVK
ncbi:pyridoxal phosphate-dependent aminotransferase [Solitalea canadensis]|uniref:Aminotransferase n=1 Tax=Solitalea canadensis (strain ATCC 29591 / DSM 3403 / JCM 21819 / LMG 8368 / NBRC 15130 / NCIMB 12057 / USAM 9D) TaxID=929556 RepID=H8KQZ9_SOLCM|nr:pyridoxal phosphate-dependent aminotransferase [Solitalea canadensis]AFD07145.1 aspartate/tyrosine/aromatic aminotransferase [Solitalea canadensis DSM 3403]